MGPFQGGRSGRGTTSARARGAAPAAARQLRADLRGTATRPPWPRPTPVVGACSVKETVEVTPATFTLATGVRVESGSRAGHLDGDRLGRTCGQGENYLNFRNIRNNPEIIIIFSI